MNLGKENEQREYKETTSELNAALEDIGAILNKHGSGELYFGVKDNGDVVGFQIGKNTEDDISRKIYENIEPKIYPDINEIELDGKAVIKVSFHGMYRPYSVKGRHFIRVSDDSRIMSEQELVNFIRNIDYTNSWEDQITDFGFEDIDEEALMNFYEKAEKSGRLDFQVYNKENLLKYLGLADEHRLNKAGYYLFGKDVDLNLKLSVLATEDKTTFLDLKQRKDNIYNLVDAAQTYIYQNIRWRAKIESERIDIPEIPEKAIREIVVNCFAHAQYESITEHEINIYPNRIEIYNPGTFPNNLTPLDFVNASRRSIIRNKLILDVLFRSKDVEKGGSGFKRVYSACNDANIKCDYILDDYGFTFIFYRNYAGSVVVEPELIIGDLDFVAKEVYKIIKSDPRIKKSQIANKLLKSEKTIQRALSLLQNKGYIERVGNYKNGYWKIL